MSSPRQIGRALSRPHQVIRHIEPRQPRTLASALLSFLLLILTVATTRAAYPPILVVDGTGYAGTAVSGSDARQYTTGEGILILSCSNGGNVSWGSDPGSLAVIGTWDGALTVNTGGTPVVQVPQVLVYYSSATDDATLDGYDNAQYPPLCNNAIGSQFVQGYGAVSGSGLPPIPDGYIFNFGDSTPCYRYCAGPWPKKIHTESGWPASTVYLLPQTMYIDGQQVTATSFTQGIDGGYWSNATYAGGSVTALIQVYASSDSPTGTISGYMGMIGFSDDWDPASNIFTPIAGLGVSTTPQTGGPLYGPPNVASQTEGGYIPFAFSDLEGDDVYTDGEYQVVIDSNDSVTEITPWSSSYDGTYTYDSTSHTFSDWDLAAVSADGQSFLGPGITIRGSSTMGYSLWDGGIYGADYGPGTNFELNETDGSTSWFLPQSECSPGLFNIMAGNGPLAFTPSPFYLYTSGTMNIDARNGWPGSAAQQMPVLSNTVTVDGVQMTLDWDSPDPLNWQQYSVDQEWSYSDDAGDWFDTDPVLSWDSNGNVSNPSGTFTAYVNGENVTGTIDQYYNLLPSNSQDAATFGSPPQQPSDGPPEITWNMASLHFSYTGDDGTDYYVDSTGSITVAISAPAVTGGTTGAVLATSTTISTTVSGTYNFSTNAFIFSGTSMQNFAAQDSTGELMGVPDGLEMYFNEAGDAASVQLGSGAYLSATNATVYTFQRNDGTYGVKYVGIPSPTPILIQDYTGAYSSPVYICNTSSNDFSVDCTVSGTWPADHDITGSGPTLSIYPAILYVNGNCTTIDDSTLASGGGGQAQTGGVSYHVQPTVGSQSSGLASINWAWGTGGFTGAVTGSYATFLSFSGTWNGISFTGLPKGLVITTNPPATLPSGYPPEISWNGVDLTFNPVASSISGSNPSGAYVYNDTAGLGLSATVSATATESGQSAVTLVGPNGQSYAGDYNVGTSQFTFSGSSSPGTVTAAGGTYGGTPPVTSGTATEIAGDLDIAGNYLTMGTWFTSGTNGESVNAMAISYADTTGTTPSLIQFAATRASTDWVWSEATSDNTEPQIPMMVVDPTHRVLVHDTTSQNVPTVILDPNGPSSFKKGLRVPQLGDVSMGTFTTGTAP